MKRLCLLLVALIGAIIFQFGEAFAQVPRSEAFHRDYTLTEVVVLSRHNIRSPLSGPESVLGRITPHEWFPWTSGKSELSLRGGALETLMGQFFRKWLVSEGLIGDNHLPAEGTIRFYANSMQRTIATAQYFSSGMLPVANVSIEHHYELNTMDPVFTPKLTVVSDDYRQRAIQQIADRFGGGTLAGVGARLTDNYALLSKVLDIKHSAAAKEGLFTGFKTDDMGIRLELDMEPRMEGSQGLAYVASDALVLQYYEEPDERKAAFGRRLKQSQWQQISTIKDYYGDVLFTTPLIAINVAHPLLKTLYEELHVGGRQFTFLCGHDSNIGSVLAALGVRPYTLPQSIETTIPIGCKLVIEKWQGKDVKDYVALNLVYQSTSQLRQVSLLSLENPPMVVPLSFESLKPNADGLFSLSDLDDLLRDCIAAYDRLVIKD